MANGGSPLSVVGSGDGDGHVHVIIAVGKNAHSCWRSQSIGIQLAHLASIPEMGKWAACLINVLHNASNSELAVPRGNR